jgi:hypothetical protein
MACDDEVIPLTYTIMLVIAAAAACLLAAHIACIDAGHHMSVRRGQRLPCALRR